MKNINMDPALRKAFDEKLWSTFLRQGIGGLYGIEIIASYEIPSYELKIS